MEIRKVGVLGAGQMGLGIAQAAARAGFETYMAKATPGLLDAQRGKVEKQLQREVEKGKLTAADHGALLDRLRWTTHMHDLADVDIVIESIVEELPVKREHFSRLDDVVKDDAIFASNTSTLTVAEIAAATPRRRRAPPRPSPRWLRMPGARRGPGARRSRGRRRSACVRARARSP